MLIEFYELLEESPPQVTLELSEADAPERAAQEIGNFFSSIRNYCSNATMIVLRSNFGDKLSKKRAFLSVRPQSTRIYPLT